MLGNRSPNARYLRFSDGPSPTYLSYFSDPYAFRARAKSGMMLPMQMPESLTVRQRDVLRELKRGLTEAQVARRLRIAYSTVHAHVKEIYREFGVHSRAQLLVKCFRPNTRHKPAAARRKRR